MTHLSKLDERTLEATLARRAGKPLVRRHTSKRDASKASKILSNLAKASISVTKLNKVVELEG